MYAQDNVSDHVDDEENVSESQVCSKQFVVLNSYSMNFQAGKDEINCWTNDAADPPAKKIFESNNPKNREYDQSDLSDDLQRTSEIAKNFPYSFNTMDVLLACLDLEEDP